MKFGIREICDVIYKARANMKVGNKIFYKGEPVLLFDTLKSSTLEGAVTTVYAQGGRGNSRLVAWDGERTVTFTMEDALISPEGLMILTGAGLIDATNEKKIPVHVNERTAEVVTADGATYLVVAKALSDRDESTIYAMTVEGDDIVSEPYIAKKAGSDLQVTVPEGGAVLQTDFDAAVKEGRVAVIKEETDPKYNPVSMATDFGKGVIVLVDYYTDKGKGTQQIDIGPESFGGNFYVEASTLFRNKDGVDMPAEIIIPNAKVQSNFSFAMASSGDPSTFTFTMDAFPDYTKFDKTEKVFASIQVVNESQTDDMVRDQTVHNPAHDKKF